MDQTTVQMLANTGGLALFAVAVLLQVIEIRKAIVVIKECLAKIEERLPEFNLAPEPSQTRRRIRVVTPPAGVPVRRYRPPDTDPEDAA